MSWAFNALDLFKAKGGGVFDGFGGFKFFGTAGPLGIGKFDTIL